MLEELLIHAYQVRRKPKKISLLTGILLTELAHKMLSSKRIREFTDLKPGFLACPAKSSSYCDYESPPFDKKSNRKRTFFCWRESEMVRLPQKTALSPPGFLVAYTIWNNYCFQSLTILLSNNTKLLEKHKAFWIL